MVRGSYVQGTSFVGVNSFRSASEHIELPAKLLDYFLRSNERNINQMAFGKMSWRVSGVPIEEHWAR